MTSHRFTLAGQTLTALPSGALFWPTQNLLCVSDLHFGKSTRLASRGGALLPPYETRATLTRLDADLETTKANTVVCLGDSFDDLHAAQTLDDADHLWLTRLMAGRDWTWVEGSHDPIPLGGTHRAEITCETLTFRHMTAPQAGAEISGHTTPKPASQANRTPASCLTRPA